MQAGKQIRHALAGSRQHEHLVLRLKDASASGHEAGKLLQDV
jgi:hypothetical protein